MLCCEFWEIFKNTFFIEHLYWLLLSVKHVMFSNTYIIVRKTVENTLEMKPHLALKLGKSKPKFNVQEVFTAFVTQNAKVEKL